MPKTLIRLLLSGFLLLAASLTLSAADLKAATDSNFLTLALKVAPPRVVCIGDTVPLIVTFNDDFEKGGAPLAPLYPIKIKGMKSKEIILLPGSLTAVTSKGTISPSTLAVGYGPSDVEMQYTAEKVGEESLLFILDYPEVNGRKNLDVPLEIKNCFMYKFILVGSAGRHVGDYIVTAWAYAEGDLISTGESVEGEMEIEGGFKLTAYDENLVECTGGGSTGRGRMTVNGYWIVSENGTQDLRLVLKYDMLTNFSDSTTVCKDKATGKVKQNYDLKPKEDVDPAEYLEKDLYFTNPGANGYCGSSFGGYGYSQYQVDKIARETNTP